MRILQVIHQYPPFSSQGSEVYCQQLSHCLVESGDAVGVFHISNTSPRRPHRLVEGDAEGIRTFHCITTGDYARLADWPNDRLRRCFQQVLKDVNPQVVHFHNYLSLGDDLVTLARASGAAVVYTLHDFGLICPNNLLRQSDGSLCAKQNPDFFEACCPAMIRSTGGRVPPIASRLPSLARWRQFADNFPHRLRRRALQAAVGTAEHVMGLPENTHIQQKRNFYFTHTRRIFAEVDLFLAPSAFLRQRYVSCGLSADKVVHVRYGMRHFPRQAKRPSEKGALRFGYIGAFHAHKGIQVLLKAFDGLGDRASLHIHGSSFGSPVSDAHFSRISADPASGVNLHGRYDNSRIGELLADLDAVIVPSVWFENAPLTIQEAFIAGVPVVTSDQGGMAELVRDGVDGLHFRLGDAEDLRRQLERLIREPELLEGFRRHIPEIPEISQQSSVVRQHYEALLSNRPGMQ